MIGAILAGTYGVTLPFSPSNLAGLKAWYDASDTSSISVSTNAVTQWNDKSGNAYHLTQGTAAARPTSGLSTQNSLNVITFDGGDWLLNTTKANWKFLHDTSKSFMCFAIKVTSGTNPGTAHGILDTNGTSNSNVGALFYYDDRTATSSNDALLHGVGVNVIDNKYNNALASPNTYKVLSVLSDPNNGTAANRSYVGVDNTHANNNTLTGTPSSSDPSDNLFIGTFSAVTSWGITGGIAEIVMVSGSDATAANRDKVITYLKDKWAI